LLLAKQPRLFPIPSFNSPDRASPPSDAPAPFRFPLLKQSRPILPNPIIPILVEVPLSVAPVVPDLPVVEVEAPILEEILSSTSPETVTSDGLEVPADPVSTMMISTLAPLLPPMVLPVLSLATENLSLINQSEPVTSSPLVTLPVIQAQPEDAPVVDTPEPDLSLLARTFPELDMSSVNSSDLIAKVEDVTTVKPVLDPLTAVPEVVAVVELEGSGAGSGEGMTTASDPEVLHVSPVKSESLNSSNDGKFSLLLLILVLFDLITFFF
jgi:hypothetical protein